MSVSGTEVNISYAGDGGSFSYTYPYYFMADTDLVVTVTDDTTGDVTNMTFNVDYTVRGDMVNGVWPDGGVVVLIDPTAAPTGSTLLITRRTPQNQVAVYQPEDPFPAKTHEVALDRIQLLHQELARHFKGWADGIPTKGMWEVDDWFFIRNAADFGFQQIICTVAGTDAAATWKPMNPISA